ncbi:Nucleotidyltransferase [[Leptolyngbya] sp. PCC 7376]|uniref:nucleotidyltransferase domain-containing protein n=1 Tax=[Leptolyngbya] sp. PCC 7376 TaxID=111781 RepID=UPI00029F034E|nr:nucleotidyltransferase domain-containing protein [[Leptolyngbya] sp. PCC 7376]AFY36692.1 Nucleotidyltransferase [[Leptolyngbya] sp. PCC 7376]
MEHVIKPEIKQEILRRLRAAEFEHNVKILYACESGSRAWGFASLDSDYDVRFIYAHLVDWYLSFDVERKRDVIEYPIVDEIDCNGWDIRKAMYLFSRTNGALLEWLKSPIRYLESSVFAARLRNLENRAANRRALCYHYSHMARGNAKDYLFRGQARLKKYFYVLRPLLAIRYIEAYDLPPPIEFQSLVDTVAPAVIKPAISKLLALKKQSSELGYGPPIKEINGFIAAEITRHGSHFTGPGRPDMHEREEMRIALNDLFREVLSN